MFEKRGGQKMLRVLWGRWACFNASQWQHPPTTVMSQFHVHVGCMLFGRFWRMVGARTCGAAAAVKGSKIGTTEQSWMQQQILSHELCFLTMMGHHDMKRIFGSHCTHIAYAALGFWVFSITLIITWYHGICNYE